MFGSINDRSLSTLTSPGFLTALFVLLLNDFFLKSYLHNALTGKLSDFAGLFVFPLFWAVFLPRFRSWIYLGTGVVFILWKSPAADLLIDGWNRFGSISVARTIDYTDLWALAILPISYVYGLRTPVGYPSRAFPALIGFISLFAFVATSFSHKTPYDNAYYFAMSKHEVLERMSQLSKQDEKRLQEQAKQYYPEAEEFSLRIESCIDAKFRMTEKDNQAVITLIEIDYRCPTLPSKEKLRQVFEQEFVEKLRTNPVIRSEKVGAVWGHPKVSSPSPSPTTKSKPSKVRQP